jgi:hypothetical protein
MIIVCIYNFMLIPDRAPCLSGNGPISTSTSHDTGSEDNEYLAKCIVGSRTVVVQKAKDIQQAGFPDGHPL